MNRVDLLNSHLNNLIKLNSDGHGDYSDEIQNTIKEINNELGIGTEAILGSYTNKELHNELNKRTNVFEVVLDLEQEAVLGKVVGDEEESTSIKGPARILINQD